MDVNTIAVVGAGTMGRGIAYAAALAGYHTILQDVASQILEQAVKSVRGSLDEGVARGRVSPEQKDRALALLNATQFVEEAGAQADLVIEAVPENLSLKTGIFETLSRIASKRTILASNTSSLSIAELAAVVENPGRVIGMHFFNPVPKMRLLELVTAPETSDETIAACREVGRRMNKEVVVVRDAPGFITSRINALIGNEAFHMLEAGVASARDIDTAVKLGLNHPMGPFEMVDLVGLDVRLSILEYLHKTLGEKFRPCPLMVKYVKEGRLGRKSGRGVYDYTSSAAGAP
jgi:3-hydroxybutyryl-CoA dehydrogenase